MSTLLEVLDYPELVELPVMELESLPPEILRRNSEPRYNSEDFALDIIAQDANIPVQGIRSSMAMMREKSDDKIFRIDYLLSLPHNKAVSHVSYVWTLCLR